MRCWLTPTSIAGHHTERVSLFSIPLKNEREILALSSWWFCYELLYEPLRTLEYCIFTVLRTLEYTSVLHLCTVLWTVWTWANAANVPRQRARWWNFGRCQLPLSCRSTASPPFKGFASRSPGQIPKSNVKLTETGNYSMTNATITFDYGRAFGYLCILFKFSICKSVCVYRTACDLMPSNTIDRAVRPECECKGDSTSTKMPRVHWRRCTE